MSAFRSHHHLIEPLLARCPFPAAGTTVDCAVSGGPDSMALLILASAAGCTVHAHHVDHGLREGSSAEAGVVSALAARLGAHFSAISLQVEPGPNVEARAREQRYEALPPGVLLGHTADDQAETVLLALLRGSAWQGLGGMTPSGQRPLLGLRRVETVGLCDALGVEYVVDPSNADPRHRRNRVRSELLPLLDDIAERDLVPVLVRQAELFRQGGEALDDQAAGIDPADARAVAAAPDVLARLALRRWIWEERGGPHPPDLATVDRALEVARGTARGTDVGGGWRVERTQQRLRLVPPEVTQRS